MHVQNPSAGLVKPHVARTHLMCLIPPFSHFDSISLHRTRQNNSTYTAITSCNDKYRGKRPRDRSGVRGSKLTKDWLVRQKESKGSLFFPGTPGTKMHTFTRPRWLINAEQTEGSAVRALVCMCPFLLGGAPHLYSSPSHLHSSFAAHSHSSQGPHILWISFCFSVLTPVNSHLFTLPWPLLDLWNLWSRDYPQALGNCLEYPESYCK